MQTFPLAVAAIVLAAGRGLRAMGNDSVPKQYQRIGGVPLLTRTLAAVLSNNANDVDPGSGSVPPLLSFLLMVTAG